MSSTRISERFWNGEEKGEQEARREEVSIADIILKAHVDRELINALPHIETALDAGAGSGRHSIFLARQGVQVTHFDISAPMIEKARQLACEAGVEERMTFVQGKLEDLSAYADASFDLVLSTDAPISYTWPRHGQVIGELLRVAAKKVVFSVAGLYAWLPYPLNPALNNRYLRTPGGNNPDDAWMRYDEAALEGYMPDFDLLERAWRWQMFDDPEGITAGTLDDNAWPPTYLFIPEELQGIMTKYGAVNIRLAGPGALSRSMHNRVLRNILDDPAAQRRFLDLCYRFDSQPSVAGLGKDNLLACADKG